MISQPRRTLLVEGDECLGDTLADGVQLGNATSAVNSDAHVDVLEALLAEDQDGLVRLLAEARGLEELDGLAIDLDEAGAGLGVGDGDRVLLAAENLDGLDLAHGEFLPHKKHRPSSSSNNNSSSTSSSSKKRTTVTTAQKGNTE